MARKKNTEENEKLKVKDCWHCVNCKADSSCGYRCVVTGKVLPHEKISDRVECIYYSFDKSTVLCPSRYL